MSSAARSQQVVAFASEVQADGLCTDPEAGVMRRLPHGATTHPPVTRPGNGYGRPLKVGPSHQLRAFAVKASKRTRDARWLLAVPLDD